MSPSDCPSFLMVTFPVDLGNRTYESNFQKLFGDQCLYHRFAADHADILEKGVNYQRNFKDRLRGALRLRQAVKQARHEGKKIIFHGISPALFSYGSWAPDNTCIILDWTRSLYPRTLGLRIKKDIAWHIHRHVLKSCKRILCLTEAARESVILDYGIDPDHTSTTPAPFDLESLGIQPRATPNQPKVLFLGGDLQRKGGDLLLDAVKNGVIPHGSLTMATTHPSANIAGVNHCPGIRFGTPEHREMFSSHDILILPTRIDSYPQAIGEAAAAGLAVITTKFALGASQVINHQVSGIITNTPEESIDDLVRLIGNPGLITSMKEQAYQHMHQSFSRDRILDAYLTKPWP